ncbi:MAG: hypothetical protein GF344_17040 [Chitinivibrionales bacterium]|nr:hypothetical protein [Chitinivibrionales bacterium]MBD3358390.1 hypothetical protein [Chitinivibrionales bacterium]
MTDKKEKRLCKWKKDDYAERFNKLRSIVADPTCVCRKCGRAANGKRYLCKPVSLEEASG